MSCCCWWSWFVLVASCWRDAFVCVACSLIDAVVISESFAMCDVMVLAIVLDVLLLDSSFIVRSAKRSCADATVPEVGLRWYASWICGRRLIHVWSALGLHSQSLRLRWYIPVCAMRLSALMRSCCVVYRFLARVAISWTSVHLLNRISGGSCGLYTAKKLPLFWRIASGVACCMLLPADWICHKWSSLSSNPLFVGGATLKGSLTCSSSVS